MYVSTYGLEVPEDAQNETMRSNRWYQIGPGRRQIDRTEVYPVQEKKIYPILTCISIIIRFFREGSF